MNYPIEYKMIPTQFAFLVGDDGTVQIKQVTKPPKEMKCKDVKEARKFIREFKELI
jgi:hypothetical protein